MIGAETATVGKPQSAEMHPGPGFRCGRSAPTPRRCRAWPARDPGISDLMNRLYAMEPEIRN